MRRVIKIVGLFTDKIKAEQVSMDCDTKHGWREGGQNCYEVYELPKPNIVDEEYL